MSTPTPTTSAKTHFDLLHEVQFTTRFDLPEKCPECGEGVTAMLTEVVETLDAQKMVAQLKVAPEMLAEHRRTLGQLERMQVMTKHLAKTDPLAEEIAAAIKGTKAIIAKAEGGE